MIASVAEGAKAAGVLVVCAGLAGVAVGGLERRSAMAGRFSMQIEYCVP